MGPKNCMTNQVVAFTTSIIYYYITHIGRTDFLKYATGSGVVPPIGLWKVKIVLATTGDTIHTSTCINTITIPKFDEVGYNTFKVVMDSIIGSQDFTSI